MTNVGELAGHHRHESEWGQNWIDERLMVLDDDEWLSSEQKLIVRKNIDYLVERIGSINVARLVQCAGWSTLFPAISWHIEALAAMDRSQGGEYFIERIQRGVAQDAASILELAWRFVSVGARVEVEPAVAVGGVFKKPDLALLDEFGERICLVEAAANADSTDQSTTDGFMKRIQPILFENGFMNIIAGSFTRVLTDEEFVTFERRLKVAADALNTSGDQLVSEDGVYRIVVSKDNGDGGHESACKRYGLQPRAITYPPFDSREEVRTLRKLKREMLHFPTDSPALVVIEANPLMVLVEEKKQRFAALQGMIRPWLDQQTGLVAVVVTVRCLAPQVAAIFECHGDLLIEQSLGLTGLDHVLLFNPAFESQASARLRKMILDAFLKDFL